MHRHQPGGRRHLRPVADAADMPGVAQGHHRQPLLPALVDADGDRLRRHGLAEAVQAVDHRQHRRFGDHLDLAVGDHHAVFFHCR